MMTLRGVEGARSEEGAVWWRHQASFGSGMGRVGGAGSEEEGETVNIFHDGLSWLQSLFIIWKNFKTFWSKIRRRSSVLTSSSLFRSGMDGVGGAESAEVPVWWHWDE